GGEGFLQGVQELLDQALIVPRASPQDVDQRVQDRRECSVRQRPRIVDADGQQARSSVLLPRGLVGDLNLAGQRLALHRLRGEQWNDDVGGIYLAFDLPCPLHSRRAVPIGKDLAASPAELRLQQLQDVLVRPR